MWVEIVASKARIKKRYWGPLYPEEGWGQEVRMQATSLKAVILPMLETKG